MSSSDTTSEGTGAHAALDATGEPEGRRPGIVWMSIAGVLAVVLVAAGVLSLLGSSTPKSTIVGTRLPAFTLPGVEGGSVTMPWGAGHPAVVVLFASWCAPCHAELARIASLVGDGDLGGVRVVGIDADIADEPAAAFVAASHVRFPVAHDGTLTWTEKLSPNLPATVFVTSHGVIDAVHYGSIPSATLLEGVARL